MIIDSVRVNARKRAFEVHTAGRMLQYPFAKSDPEPTSSDPVVAAEIDEELGREGFTYRLASGTEGALHVEQVLEYNRDPDYMRDLLLYRLSVEAADLVAASGLSHREIIRRLGTSPAQFYRLLDPTNYRKSLDRLLALLEVLDYDVDFVVTARR